MLLRVAVPRPTLADALVTVQQARGMASLKDLKTRMNSVSSIRKITASMKLVAASKLKSAQENNDKNRPFLEASRSFLANGRGYEEGVAGELKPKSLFLLLTSDRGLCGSINSGLIRQSKQLLKDKTDPKLLIAGDKGRAGLLRDHVQKYIFTVSELGKPKAGCSWADMEPIAEKILATDFDTIRLLSNKFISVISFEPIQRSIISKKRLVEEIDLSQYENETDWPELLENYYQHFVASILYSALTENTAAELSARMTSMDNATKNAGEMLSSLTLQYNRQRQAGITKELAEIVAGAESVKDIEKE